MKKKITGIVEDVKKSVQDYLHEETKYNQGGWIEIEIINQD